MREVFNPNIHRLLTPDAGREVVACFSDDTRLDKETRLKMSEKAVYEFKNILSGIEGYAVVSSMAKALNDIFAGKEIAKPPADIDIAVFRPKKESKKNPFDLIIQRLRRAGAVFHHYGSEIVIESRDPVSFMPDKTKVVCGYLPMRVGGQDINYRFEIFYESRIAPPELESMCEDFGGLKFLNREALKIQYALNTEIEGRVRRNVEEILIFLKNSRELLEDPEYRKKVLRALDLDEAELKKLFKLLDKSKTGQVLETKRADYNEIVLLLTGGLKEKLFNRLKKLEELQADTRVEIMGQKKEVSETVEEAA